jgi:DNA-binding beta-propeller fold protein YncE
VRKKLAALVVAASAVAVLAAPAGTSASPTTPAKAGLRTLATTNPATNDGAAQATSNLSTDRIFVISQRVNDLVYDRGSGRIYVSVPSNGGAYANSVVPFDPYTRTFGTAIPIGLNPNKLALSDNGEFLYVGVDGDAVVRRLQLASGTTDL